MKIEKLKKYKRGFWIEIKCESQICSKESESKDANVSGENIDNEQYEKEVKKIKSATSNNGSQKSSGFWYH